MQQVTKAENMKMSSYLAMPTMQKHLHGVLGERKEKFVTNLVSVTSQNKVLEECTNSSVVAGAIVATSLNLSLNSSFGYAYLVPFKNKKFGNAKEAQFQIGWKGYVQLAMRTGQYRRINAIPIKENQFISWSPLMEELKLRNEATGVGKTVGYVGFFELTNGFIKTIFWTHDQMLNHADQYSQAFNKEAYKKLINNEIPESEMWKYSSFWYKNFDDMALKTIMRQLLSKFGILSEDMQIAYESDNAVIREDGTRDYVEAETYSSEDSNEPIDPFEEKQETINEATIEDYNHTKEEVSAIYSKATPEKQAQMAEVFGRHPKDWREKQEEINAIYEELMKI